MVRAKVVPNLCLITSTDQAEKLYSDKTIPVVPLALWGTPACCSDRADGSATSSGGASPYSCRLHNVHFTLLLNQNVKNTQADMQHLVRLRTSA